MSCVKCCIKSIYLSSAGAHFNSSLRARQCAKYVAMKKYLQVIFLFLVLISSLSTYAAGVKVKGYVLFTGGSPVAGVQVKIAGYLAGSTTPCSEQVVTTNATGFYSLELSCTGDINRTRMVVKNCDGLNLVQEKEVPTSKVVEANFTVCKPPATVTCTAKFNAEPVPSTSTLPPFSFAFNSSTSEVTSGDKIIHRIWNFNDGSPLVNDRVDPSHTFPQAGTYEVCLTIKTDKGCESRICKAIVVKPLDPVTCMAKFNAEPVPSTSTLPPFSFQFNSSSSEVTTGDKIIHRIWDFHDGLPLVNDRVDPSHSFPHAGTYEVCLIIKTDKGCESRICKAIVVQPVTAVTCTAKFNFEKLALNKFRFNGNMNMLAANDYVTARKWDFHDGTTSTEVSPLHEFVKPGNYEVCLTIKTANGCESHFCTLIKVEEMPMSANDYVKIISLYPSPVRENLKAVVYSKLNNITGSISIINLYGSVQYTRRVVLLQGYNSFTLPVFSLMPGSYFFKVKTQFGTLSKSFYKM